MKTCIPLVAAFLVVGVIHLRASTIPVTSTADSGAGSLRQALASAADGDTIDASGVSGTILLTSGELLVSHSVTVVGPGPDKLALDGNAASHVFHIINGVTAAISSLTISNGAALEQLFPGNFGGGILNDRSTLTVSNCTLSGNSAFFGGGINNYVGELMVINCTVSGNSAVSGIGGGIAAGYGGTTKIIASAINNNSATFGGGIDNGGSTLTMSNCTVSGNSGDGGGIRNLLGTLEIIASTISGNSGSEGGGMWNESATAKIIACTISSNSAMFGGGLYNDGSSYGSATMTVADSTISGNSAGGYVSKGGGIANNGGMLTVSASTLSGNSASASGGIFNGGEFGGSNGGTVEIGNTILQTGASGENIVNSGGTTINSLGYNLSSDDGGGFLTATGDQTNADPRLGPLQDNGGPTFTHALLAGSPAIDQGKNFSASATDQRGTGFARTYDNLGVANAAGGDGTDIGAFEVQPKPVDTDGDGVIDDIDQCPNTPLGAIVNADGCSIAQLVPCDGPALGGKWKSHGQYVQAVVKAATDFLRVKLISRRQWMEIVTRAAWSKCGWNRRCDHNWDRDWHRDWDCDRDRDWGRYRNWDRD